MNRSQRRLQQLKETVSMKLAILEKQKEDIKEVIDDYSVQVVAKVEHLLGNELDLLRDQELCHEVIRSLDKASQVFTDVAINLDKLLDAAENRPVSATTESEPLKLNTHGATDNENSEIISGIPEPRVYETDRSVQQTNNTTCSQFEIGEETRQHQMITQQQAEKNTQKQNEEMQSGNYETQCQEQQEQLKDHVTLAGCLLHLSTDDMATREVTKTTGPKYAQCSSNCGKAETANLSCDSSLTSPLISAAPSLLSSEIINSLMPDGHTTTHHSDSTYLLRTVSSPNDAIHQFQESCNISDHMWNLNSTVSEHHVDFGPLIPTVSSHNSLSVSVCSGNPVHSHGIPPQTNGQPSSSPLIADHSGRIVPVLMDAGSLPVANSVPAVISPTSGPLLENSVSGSRFCNPVSTEQSFVDESVSPSSRTASQQSLDNSFRLRESVYPLSQCTASTSDLAIVSTLSQGQQLNQSQTLCYPALTPMITELIEPTLSVSESSIPSPEVSGAASAIYNVSMSSIGKQKNMPNCGISALKSMLGSDKENMECKRSEQPHLEQVQDTVAVSSASGKCTTAAVTKKTLKGSAHPISSHHVPLVPCGVEVKGSAIANNSQGCTQNDINSTASYQQLQAKASHVPKNLVHSLRKKGNVKSSSKSRNLSELIKEVEKAARKRSTEPNKVTQIEKTSKAQVLKTKPVTALAEAAVSPLKPKEPGLKVPYNKSQTTLLSGEGHIQESVLDNHATEVTVLTMGSLQLEKDSVFSAIVSTSIHPWSFHVQRVELIPVISGLITHAVKTGETTSIIPHIGQLCLAKSNNHHYCRARILSLEEDQDGQIKSVKVCLVDYGIRKAVSPADVSSIPDSLMQYPCQAIFCALHKAGPKNSNCLWTEEAILEFQQCVKDKQVQVRVVYPSPSETQLMFPHIVDVMFTTPHAPCKEVRSMAEYLIEEDLAKDIQVEEQIAALWDMYAPGKHNASCRMTGLEVGLSHEKVQPVSQAQLDVQHKLKVLHQPLCFKKGKAKKISLSDRTSTTNSSLSSCSYSSSVSDFVDVPQSRIPPGAEEKYNLSILVDEKLHSWCTGITSSHTDKWKVTERHKAGEDSELRNFCDSSLPLFGKGCKDVEILVMISQVISPSSFFVHPIDEDFIQKLQTLEEELLELSTTLTKQPATFNPAMNCLVCVTDSAETNCYRGVVLDIASEEDMQGHLGHDESSGHKFLIFLMDSGDFEWVPRSRLFPLPSKFKNLAPLVVWCTLEGVQPAETATYSNGESTMPLLWPHDVVSAFKSMASENKVFSAILTEESFQLINTTTNFQCAPVPVFLLDKSLDGEDICLNHELICHSLASLRPLAPELDQSRSIPEWDPMTEEYRSIRNSYKVDTDEAGVAIVGYTAGIVPKGGQKVCVHFNRPKGCIRGDRCPDLHVTVDLCDVPYGKAPVKIFDEDQSDLLPQTGSSVTVMVSVVFTPSRFYITLPWGHSSLQQLQDPQVRSQHSQEETLDSMMANMQKFYSTHPGHDRDLTLLASGEAVAAQVRGQWNRAKVIFTDVERGLVQVVLVDYGSVAWVSERDLRELGWQFLHLTPQAIECSLAYLQPPDESGTWNQETCTQFSQMVKGQTFLAYVKHRYPSGRIGVVLFDASGNTSTSVNQRLQDGGLAHNSAASGTVERASDESQRPDDGHNLSIVPG